MTYLIFDLETTGLPSGNVRAYKDYNTFKECRIVSIGWVILGKDMKEITNKYYVIQRDGFTIPPNVHGITNKISDTIGIDIHVVFEYLLGDIIDYLVDMLGAHNIVFDKNVLLHHVFRYSHPTLYTKIRSLPTYCTMIGGKDLLKIPLKNHRIGEKMYKYPNLKELYAFFRPDLQFKAHDAIEDARACATCFASMYGFI